MSVAPFALFDDFIDLFKVYSLGYGSQPSLQRTLGLDSRL